MQLWPMNWMAEEAEYTIKNQCGVEGVPRRLPQGHGHVQHVVPQPPRLVGLVHEAEPRSVVKLVKQGAFP